MSYLQLYIFKCVFLAFQLCSPMPFIICYFYPCPLWSMDQQMDIFVVNFVVKSVVSICIKNCGEIEKLSDWNKNWCGKIQKTKQKTQPQDSRTRGPVAPAVLVKLNFTYICSWINWNLLPPDPPPPPIPSSSSSYSSSSSSMLHLHCYSPNSPNWRQQCWKPWLLPQNIKVKSLY